MTFGVLTYLRYCNMDYIAGSATWSFDNVSGSFYSYDITCQWKIKLCKWMKKILKETQIQDDMALDFGIPKLHCKAHKYMCQCQYSMNIWHGLRCTCGEGIEWTLDDISLCALFMKEMGLGAHHDIIDNQFSGHNLRKETQLGTCDWWAFMGPTDRLRCTGHLLHEKHDQACRQFN